jgi:hypothetical protein
VAAGLLCDQGFVTSMIASLPGVDPHSPLVWEAVTELQEALSQQQGVASAQQQQHRMMEPP